MTPSINPRRRWRRTAAAVTITAGLVAGASSAASAHTAPTRSAMPAVGEDVVGLQLGSRGEAVKAVQNVLIRHGYVLSGGADGIFGPSTQRAVLHFQRANGIQATGTITPATAKLLGLAGGGAAARGSAPASAPAAPAAAPAVQGLQQGASGAAVSALQAKLRGLGLVVDADGTFGARTARAVSAVQKVNGLPQTGVVDAKTAALLGGVPGVAAPAASAPSPSAGVSGAAGYATYDEQGARTVALQRALMNAGMALRGGADGKFGSGTLAAIIDFQRARGLAVTGKVDSATAAALGLSPMPKPATPTYAPIVLEAKPVGGRCYFGDTWGAARSLGRSHLGTDVIAAAGTPLNAVFTGKVIQIYRDGPGSLSGNGVKIARPDGTYAFYAHLSSLAPGIDVGVPVSAGQLLGYVGSTGNAAGPHLHFELHPGGGSAVNPYPTLSAQGAC